MGFEPTRSSLQAILSRTPWTSSGILALFFSPTDIHTRPLPEHATRVGVEPPPPGAKIRQRTKILRQFRYFLLYI